jgi:two-component system chemotaxis sensor kinase CheA
MSAVDPAATFRQEAQELLEQLEQALLDLEDAPGDAELVNTAFRALHTVKGSGAMFGFEAAAGFAHSLENAFDLVRQGKLSVSPPLIGLALAAKDKLRLLIDRPADVGPDEVERIRGELARLVSGASPEAETETPGRTTWRIHVALAADCLSSGTNPLLLLEELRGLGEATVSAHTDAIPPLDAIDPFTCYMSWDVILTGEKPRSAIEEVFIFEIDSMDLRIEQLEPAPRRLGEILVERGDISPEAIESAVSQQSRLGAILVKDGLVSGETVAAALAEQSHLREVAGKPEERSSSSQQASVRVPAGRLDDLLDRVGELVITQARLSQFAAASSDPHLQALAEEMERLTSELRDNTMGIRMVAIGSLFGRFRRLVRDLSQELGKAVQLVTAGEETELDKTVVERLADPIVHLIRNAIDHGLESQAERAAAGKPAESRVILSAIHSGAQVLIRIKDDGRGLDLVRIRAKAEEKGLIAPGAKLTDGELAQLIFHPGFSTAKAITNLSGRGVGMDVVKRTIESLRGSIEIESLPGQGTEITLKLPLTLAIIDGLLVRVGQGRYVIPLSAVEECVELTPAEDARSTGCNFLNIRGDLVPFLRLRELFASSQPAAPYQKVVIVTTGELRIGLVVDQVVGEHQTVIKSLSTLHADIESFSGATILGDGTVALILDLPHLADLGQRQLQRLKAS